MTELATSARAKRPEFRNIHALRDLPTYRLPAAGIVSILHRISGAIMFLLLPFIIWMFDTSISSEISFAKFAAVFEVGVKWTWTPVFRGVSSSPIVFSVPGIFFKLVALAIIWAYLHHFIAGLRHLWMDVNHAVSKEFGRSSAWFTLVVGSGLTFVLALKLFGAY